MNDHCGRTYAISIEEKINRSISLGVTPIDNMNGTYTFLNGPNNHKRSFILNFCQVCGTPCPRSNDKKTQSYNVFCSSTCKMLKMFTYEEYKRGDHKKRPPKGKYFAFNKEDLAIKYKNAVAYKETDQGLHFFVPYKGKKSHHTPRLNMLRWSLHICENCGNSYYAFQYNKKSLDKKYGSTRRYDSCNFKCRGILTVKNRYGQGSLYEPLGLLNGDYPYFRENGKIIQCHRRVIELVLGRKLTKDEHIHHIDMNKLNYNYDNLWLTTNKYHKIAHNSYNESCEELIKRGIMDFNEEKGIYYLINKET